MSQNQIVNHLRAIESQPWTMAPLRYATKFDPFLSLDCAPTPSTLAQSKERKGSNFATWQHWWRIAFMVQCGCPFKVFQQWVGDVVMGLVWAWQELDLHLYSVLKEILSYSNNKSIYCSVCTVRMLHIVQRTTHCLGNYSNILQFDIKAALMQYRIMEDEIKWWIMEFN